MPGAPGRTGTTRKPRTRIDNSGQDGLPDAPAGHSSEFYRIWKFLIAHLPQQSLRKIDAIQLGLLASMLEEIGQLDKIIDADQDNMRARGLRLRIGQQVSRLSVQFGLSPSDRMRLQLEPKQADHDDPFTELLSRLN